VNRTLVLMFPCLCVLALSVGCGGGAKYTYGKAEGEPDWIERPPRKDDIIYVVGVSPQGLTRKIARRQAEMDARTRLAQEIISRVKLRAGNTVKSLAGSESFGGDAADVAANSEDMVKDVSEVSSQTTLSGSYTEEYWTNPKNGETYALMRLDTDAVDQAAKAQLFNRVRDEMKYVDEQVTEDLKNFLEEAYDR
jgi:hypothetical protein